MRVFPVYGVIIGLLWTGPSWAGGEWSCTDLGAAAQVGRHLRELGADIRRVEARTVGPVERALPAERQAALRAAERIGYFSSDSPEATRAAVEALCRSGMR